MSDRGRSESGIERSRVREKLRKAGSELDTAVEHGAEDQAKYWLGRKEALKDLLEDRSLETATDSGGGDAQ